MGAWLALIALAFNLACSFEHHHFRHFGDAVATALHTEASVDAAPADDHERDHQHVCFTCIVVTAAAVAASPPIVLAQVWYPAEAVVTAAPASAVIMRYAGFAARAPPRS